MVNFIQCAATYIGNSTLIAQWGWEGPVRGIPKNPGTQISYEGCKTLCGSGNQWYSWSLASSTITTWILPVIGVLLQAPYESNAFWRTFRAICRWCGSPMATLSCILWNISVSGKSAMMVDMAVPFEDRTPFRDTDLGDFRDSFYILMNMNQFSMKPVPSLKEEAEGLLRIVLFSKDVRLIGTNASLKVFRRELAQSLRERRKRGAVPVFVSTMWFLFSFGISIQAAFGQLGVNATAHDLALGTLLGWLPIIIMCGIVDRNPVGTDDVRKRLNEIVDVVATSLRDEHVMNEFIMTFTGTNKYVEMKTRVERISRQADLLMGEFFTSFAGQGRVRWHYGAAQPILSDIENCYVAEHGRDWLRNEKDARMELVLGSSERGLFWFDFRQLWQIVASVIIVGGNVFSALIVSYFTPTVGLGCRSLGYLIFFMLASGLLILEFVVWWLSSEEREEERMKRLMKRQDSRLQRSITFQSLERISGNIFQRARRWIIRQRDAACDFVVRFVPRVLCIFYSKRHRARKRIDMEDRLKRRANSCKEFTLREWSDRLFFRPMEAINTGWLIYIGMAQTFGSYNNCKCMSSLYAAGGGYVDFLVYDMAPFNYVEKYWIIGTVLSSLIIGLAMAYVVLEWCLQSHLSTQDERDARRGLTRTRRFRHYTYFIRFPTSLLIHNINLSFDLITRPFRRSGYHRQKSLYWTKHITYYPPISPRRRPTLPAFSPYSKSTPTFLEFKKEMFVCKTSEADSVVDFDPDATASSMSVPLIITPTPTPGAGFSSHPPVSPSPSFARLQRQCPDTSNSTPSSASYFPPQPPSAVSSSSPLANDGEQLPTYHPDDPNPNRSSVRMQDWTFNQPFNAFQQSQEALRITVPTGLVSQPPTSAPPVPSPVTAPPASLPAETLPMERLNVNIPRRRSRSRSRSSPNPDSQGNC